MGAIFEFSALENPEYQISSKSDNFSFRSLLGGPTPQKKLCFLAKKNFGAKFWCYFWTQHLRKALETDLQQNRITIWCWLKSAYSPKKYAKNFSKNYTMLNYIEGETTLLFCTFDKTQ